MSYCQRYYYCFICPSRRTRHYRYIQTKSKLKICKIQSFQNWYEHFKTIGIYFSVVFLYIRSPKIIRKEESPMGFFIGMMFLSIYVSQHGDGLNFIDVTLLSTLAYLVIANFNDMHSNLLFVHLGKQLVDCSQILGGVNTNALEIAFQNLNFITIF